MSSVRSMMVTVGANVAPYVAGMRTAQTATGNFAATAAAARGGARRLGTGMGTSAAGAKRLGGELGLLNPKFLGPAGIVLGLKHAASKGRDFNESTIALRTQIGLTETQADGLATAARQVGTDFGVGGQAAIDASWQIASAGLRGEEAGDALESAARAAAVGFGEMETIAGLSAAAVNAYGEDALTATGATDILAAAVREGTAAPEEMASTLGSLLPIASEMGVSFDQIAAGQAAMTRTGTDAAGAATQLRSILVNMLNPAEQSRDAMAEFGLTAEGLRATIAEDGLFAALMSVRDAVGDNQEALGRIFPNQRALLGFLDLTGENAAATAGIFDELADATGTVERSFFDLERSSTQFQLDRFKSNISDMVLSLGTELDPALRESLRLLNMLFERPETDSGRPLFGVGGTGQARSVIDVGRNVLDPTRDIRNFWLDQGGSFLDDRRFDSEGEQRHLQAMRAQADQYVEGLIAAAGANDEAAAAAGRYEDALDDLGDGLSEAERQQDRLTDATQNYLAEVRRATDPIFNLRKAVEDVTEAERSHEQALKDLEEAQNDTEASAEDLAEAQREVETTAWDLFAAVLDLEGAAIDADLSFQDFEDQLDRMVAQGKINQSEADVLRGALKELVEQADEFAGERRAIFIASVDQARLDAVNRQLDGAARDRAVRFIVDQRALADKNAEIARSGGTVMLKASGGSVWPGQTAIVGEHGPELVTFAGHGRVIPANQTAHMLSAGSSTDSTFNVQQTFHGSDRTTLAEARHQQRLAFLEAV